MKDKEDLNYWKANAEEDYKQVPISVLRYITELETAVENCSIPDVSGSNYLAFMRIDHEIVDRSIKLFKKKIEAGKYICSLRKKYGSGSITYDIKEFYCTTTPDNTKER